MNELTEQLRQDAQNKLWKLKEANQITETIGPLNDFWLKYTLRRFQRPIRTEAGMAVRRTIELDRFVLVPVADNLGVPLATALQPASEFSVGGWQPSAPTTPRSRSGRTLTALKHFVS